MSRTPIILHDLCSLPTAPFLEERVVDYVTDFVRQRPRLRLSRDPSGNLLIELPGKQRNLPRWVFGAHMDHPGFVAKRMRDARTLEADFRGHVLAEFIGHTKVRFFAADREIPGQVLQVTGREEKRWLRKVHVRVQEEVPPGVLGMFDQGEGRIKGGKFYCRACDDVAGAAAALTMLDELHRTPPAAPIAVLLTRAEEEGFIGAIAASIQPKLLKKTDRIIAIETSAMQPYAPQGAGPIIRVGDRTSIFNSALTYFLTQQAEAFQKRSRSFKYQRALMPGGTCEATVYDVYGFQASSICVALGNYHNTDREAGKIGPEYVDISDWQNMVKLFVAIARHGHEYREGHHALRSRIEKRFKKVRKLL
ncbi:MAG: M20/M25/M40 family metallo-hydrolase [Bacillota bacterium]